MFVETARSDSTRNRRCGTISRYRMRTAPPTTVHRGQSATMRCRVAHRRASQKRWWPGPASSVEVTSDPHRAPDRLADGRGQVGELGGQAPCQRSLYHTRDFGALTPYGREAP